MRRGSLKRRLTIVTSVVMLVAIGVLVAAGNLLLAHTIRDDNNQRLAARLDAQVATLSVRHGQVRVRDSLDDGVLDDYGWIFSGSSLVEGPLHQSTAVDAAARRLARHSSGESTVDTGTLLLRRRDVRSGGQVIATVVVGTSLAQFDALGQQVLIGSVVFAIVLLVAGTLAVVRVLGAALAPVEQMTRDAADWQAHDLDRRFDLGEATDEITGLAATLNTLLNRIASSRRSEQRFAAEVAHELRTPLAAIRATAELGIDSDPASAIAALESVVLHSRRLATTLDTLVAEARRDATTATTGVDLTEVISSFDGIVVTSHLGPATRVEGDPHVIRQVFAPVIDNALRFAATSVQVTLSARPDVVVATVVDDGPGVDASLGVTVFLPGVRGDDEREGAGLGLSLTRRLVRSCGGSIELGEGPGGHFVITLPAA